MNIYWVVLICILLLVAGYAAVCYAFANLLLYPTRQPIVHFPDEYGIEYEKVEFLSRDGLRLRGWFIPGKLKKILLVTHPMFCNRHGFLKRYKSRLASANTDIDLLTSLKALHDAGYSILTFDFRNHGESDRGITGVGLNEYQDVIGALDYLDTRPDVDHSEIGLVGFCMGANAIIIAISKARERFINARFLIAVQPITMKVFVQSYLRSLYTRLGLVFVPLTERIMLWRGGHPLAAMSPSEYVHDITLPTLYAQARTDPWTDLSDIKGFYEKTAAPKDFWWFEGQLTRIDGYNYVGQHPERMTEFIKTYL
jgi:dipeptidyl aminopeptidase/acylaminoacyl peptidase